MLEGLQDEEKADDDMRLKFHILSLVRKSHRQSLFCSHSEFSKQLWNAITEVQGPFVELSFLKIHQTRNKMFCWAGRS